MALTSVKIKAATPKDKDFKLSDENGLFLLVKKTGAKYWRLKYRFNKKEKSLAIEVYPEVSLKEARIKRNEARALLSNGVDPSEHKKQQSYVVKNDDSFERLANDWMETKKVLG